MANHDAPFTYDVYLSFRGIDTRNTFTAHLNNALSNRGIKYFKDDESLRAGDEIAPALLEAIERSRMSIVVLSQNYASSSLCLDELVRIMEGSSNGRPVLPVFYHVDPSDVRHQTNQFGAAMNLDENGTNLPRVAAWRSALSAVGSLSGFTCAPDTNEAEIIGNIVEKVSEQLPADEPVNNN